MRCNDAEFWISLRVDGEEVPAEKRAGLDLHLADCAACRGLLSQETGRSALLARRLRGGEETALAERIIRLAAAEPPRKLRFGPWGGLFGLPAYALVPLAAAFLALAVGGGWWLATPAAPLAQPEPGFAFLEENSLDTDVMSGEAGEPVGRDTLKKHWVITPVKRQLSPQDRRKSGEVILDVERVDTRYFRFANLQYR